MAKKQNPALSGIIAFAPLVAFIIWAIYYALVLREPLGNGEFDDHKEIVSRTADNYGPLFLSLASVGVIWAIAMIHQLLHLIRQRNLNNAQKLNWTIMLVATPFVGHIIYWYQKMRRQEGDDRLHSDPQPGTYKGHGTIGDPALRK